jgi:hypothetical protein
MAAFAQFKQLVKNVTTAGTREALVSSPTLVINFCIQAKAGNTGVVYIGTSEVSSSAYAVRLTAGNSYSVEMPVIGGHAMEVDLSELYLDVGTSGDGVTVAYYVRS